VKKLKEEERNRSSEEDVEKVWVYHDFSGLLFSQDEAEGVEVGSRHQTKKQRLLAICQLTHIHCNTHTHTHRFS